jgi:hypothetical protein
MSKSEVVEPYTVIQVEGIKYRIDLDTRLLEEAQPGLFRFRVYYRNYNKTNYVNLEAKDELEAYILGQAHISKTKAAYDRRKAKKEQTK